MALLGTLNKLPTVGSLVSNAVRPRILAVTARQTHTTEDKLKDIIHTVPKGHHPSGNFGELKDFNIFWVM